STSEVQTSRTAKSFGTGHAKPKHNGAASTSIGAEKVGCFQCRPRPSRNQAAVQRRCPPPGAMDSADVVIVRIATGMTAKLGRLHARVPVIRYSREQFPHSAVPSMSDPLTKTFDLLAKTS